MKTITKTYTSFVIFSCITLLCTPKNSVFAQNFDPSDFSTPREITTVNNTTSGGNTRSMIAYGDFNSDGKNDIVKVGVNQIEILENIYTSGDIANVSTNLFNNLTPLATQTGSKNVIVADINNDTKPDIVVGCDSFASVFINSSTGGTISFNAKVDISTYGPNIGIYDIDGDGLLDLVHSSNSYYSQIGINLNDNTAGLFTSSTFNLSVTYASMEDWTFGDFDSNGTLDFFSARANSNSSLTGIHLALNNSTTGNISFGAINFKIIPGMTYASYGSPKSVECFDINNDSKMDVLVQLGNKTHFFLNNNTAALTVDDFSESNITSQNSTSNFGLNFGMGDIDDDGKNDIISPGSNSSGTFVLKNNTVGSTVSFGSPANIQSITNQTALLVDLDGDALPEIVNARYYSTFLYVVKYTGAVLSTKNIHEDQFQIYPNPTSNVFEINNKSNSLATISLYSISGRNILKHVRQKSARSEIDMSSLNSGVYIVEIKNDHGTTYKKIIKE